jgi:acyl-CoA thioesterase-1
VISQRPDLVIWQLGTNWLMQDGSLAEFGVIMRDGIKRLTSAGADMVLIDPQFAPPVITKPDLPRLVQLLSDIGDEFGINVFPRCAIMRYWSEVAGMPFDAFLAEDEFHMNDWSYNCMARLLAESIVTGVTAPASAS